jgi:uncharacterized protein (DUF1697 family)
MKDLRHVFAELGCQNVRTYIQSGNVVFDVSGSAEISGSVVTIAIEKRFGFRPYVLILTAAKYSNIVVANPFFDNGVEPKCLHIGFLSEQALESSNSCLENLRAGKEEFALTDAAFYLCAPDGIGRSKLASGAEKCLGGTVTSRNFRTVGKISELLAESQDG